MKQNLITEVVQGMLPYLNNARDRKVAGSFGSCTFQL